MERHRLARPAACHRLLVDHLNGLVPWAMVGGSAGVAIRGPSRDDGQPRDAGPASAPIALTSWTSPPLSPLTFPTRPSSPRAPQPADTRLAGFPSGTCKWGGAWSGRSSNPIGSAPLGRPGAMPGVESSPAWSPGLAPSSDPISTHPVQVPSTASRSCTRSEPPRRSAKSTRRPVSTASDQTHTQTDTDLLVPRRGPSRALLGIANGR